MTDANRGTGRTTALLMQLVEQLGPKQVGVYIVHNQGMVNYAAERLLDHCGVGLRKNRNVVLLPNGARIKIMSAPTADQAERATHGVNRERVYVDHAWWELTPVEGHARVRGRVEARP